MTAATTTTSAATAVAKASDPAKPNALQGKWDVLPNVVSFGTCMHLTDREIAVSLNRVNRYWSQQNAPMWNCVESRFQLNTNKSPLQKVSRDLYEMDKIDQAITALEKESERIYQAIEAGKKELSQLEQSWSLYFGKFPLMQTVSSQVQQAESRQKQLKDELSSLTKEHLAVQDKLRTTKRIPAHQAIRMDYQQSWNELASKEAMENFYGGKRFLLRIPVLDISKKQVKFDEWSSHNGRRVDFLQTHELAHPLMRGVDTAGRLFLTIVAKNNDELVAQIIFQQHSRGRRYRGMLDDYRYFIGAALNGVGFAMSGVPLNTNGKVLAQRQYKAIQELIQQGKTIYRTEEVRYKQRLIRPEGEPEHIVLATDEDMTRIRKSHIRNKFQKGVFDAVGEDLADRLRGAIQHKHRQLNKPATEATRRTK